MYFFHKNKFMRFLHNKWHSHSHAISNRCGSEPSQIVLTKEKDCMGWICFTIGCSAMMELYIEMLYYMSSLNFHYMQTYWSMTSMRFSIILYIHRVKIIYAFVAFRTWSVNLTISTKISTECTASLPNTVHGRNAAGACLKPPWFP